MDLDESLKQSITFTVVMFVVMLGRLAYEYYTVLK